MTHDQGLDAMQLETAPSGEGHRILTSELEETRRQLRALTAEVQRNSDILKRSQERELALLQANDLQSLFQRMLVGLAESYVLDAVTVVLCDPDHRVRHLLLAEARDVKVPDGLLFVDGLHGIAPQYGALESPWLGSFSAADHQLIFPWHHRLSSVALIPMRKDGQLFGSINFGSRQPHRFTPGHASDFFAHLGAIASFALENAVNRARLMRSGFTDPLTGWYNRRYLQVRINEELARARRNRTPLSCLLLDVDHFKRVNDDFGHLVGDDVLRRFADQVNARIRATDVAARYGGEEFVILLPETGVNDAARLAGEIREAVAASPFDLADGQSVPVTVSIGVAGTLPGRDVADFGHIGEALLAGADAALYRAKRGGRDTVEVCRDDPQI